VTEAGGCPGGGILDTVFPEFSPLGGATTLGATVGLGSELHDAGFEDDEPRAAIDRMPAHSSALFALATREWVDYMNKHMWLDDLLGYLNQDAYKVGWIPVSEKLVEALESLRIADWSNSGRRDG
jgi:uncharacterized membrane protein